MSSHRRTPPFYEEADSSKIQLYFNKTKSTASKEISRLIAYIAFGIMASSFTVFKNGNKCFLLNAVVFSALAILTHFVQYLSIYCASKKWLNNNNIDNEKKPKQPFVASDYLFVIKIIFLVISLINFVIISVIQLSQ